MAETPSVLEELPIQVSDADLDEIFGGASAACGCIDSAAPCAECGC